MNTLTVAGSARDKRDALRMLRELYAREGLPPTLDLQAVEQATGQADPEVRAEAWALFARVQPDPSARVAALEAALRDPAAPVRLSAVALLGDPARDGELLVRAVSDSDAKVRAAGVRHLATLDDGRALPLLFAALRDREPRSARRSGARLGCAKRAGRCRCAARGGR